MEVKGYRLCYKSFCGYRKLQWLDASIFVPPSFDWGGSSSYFHYPRHIKMLHTLIASLITHHTLYVKLQLSIYMYILYIIYILFSFYPFGFLVHIDRVNLYWKMFDTYYIDCCLESRSNWIFFFFFNLSNNYFSVFFLII